MHDWYKSTLIEQMRRNDEMAEARHYRLVIEARSGRPQARLFPVGILARMAAAYQLWMLSLGNRLVRWGCRLQTRYARQSHAALVEGEPSPCG